MRRLVLIAVVAASTYAQATAAQVPAPNPAHAVDAPPGVVAPGLPPELRSGPLGELSDARSLRDPDVQHHLRMILPRAHGGLGFTHVAGNEVVEGAFEFAIADADGDGLKDMFMYEYRSEYDENFELIGGEYRLRVITSHGATLWRGPKLPRDTGVYLRAADVDGDGESEILFVTLRRTTEEVIPDILSRTTIAQELAVIDGRTGATMYQKRVDGEVTEISVPTFATPVRIGEDHVWDVDVAPGDAHAGPSLFISRRDYVSVFQHHFLVGPLPSRGVKVDTGNCSTKIDLYEGASGATRTTLTLADVEVCQILRAGADTDGDGLGEFTALSSKEVDRYDRDGAHVWRTPLTIDDDFLITTERPVRTRTSVDVSVVGINLYIFSDGGGIIFLIKSDRAFAVNGQNGAVLADHRTPGYLGVMGSSDADGGTDIIEVTESPSGPFMLSAIALDGGGVRWARSYGLTGGAWLTATADVDGHDGDEVIVARAAGPGRVYDAELWRGTDASTVWSLAAVTSSRIPGPHFGEMPGGRADLNLDGREDLSIEETHPGHDLVTFVDGETMSPIGTFSLPNDDGFRLVWGVYELDGAGAPEVLARHLNPSFGFEHFEAWDAGGLRWQADIGLEA